MAVLRWTLIVLGGLLLVATVLAFAGRWWWVADLFNVFRVQYVLGLAVVLIVQAFVRPRWLVGVWVLGVVLNVAVVAAAGWGSMGWASGTSGGAEPLTVLHCNVLTGNHELGPLVDWIEESGADLVFLQELTPFQWGLLEPRLTGYRLAVDATEGGARGVAMLVQDEGAVAFEANVLRIDAGDGDRPVIEARVEHDGGVIHFLSLHTKRPGSKQYLEIQRDELHAAAVWAAQRREAEPDAEIVIVGDFNAVPWSSHINHLRRAADLELADGVTLHPTWRTPMPTPLRIPIDYALHSGGLAVTGYALGPDVGSDHLPIRLTFTRAEADNRLRQSSQP